MVHDLLPPLSFVLTLVDASIIILFLSFSTDSFYIVVRKKLPFEVEMFTSFSLIGALLLVNSLFIIAIFYHIQY